MIVSRYILSVEFVEPVLAANPHETFAVLVYIIDVAVREGIEFLGICSCAYGANEKNKRQYEFKMFHYDNFCVKVDFKDVCCFVCGYAVIDCNYSANICINLHILKARSTIVK